MIRARHLASLLLLAGVLLGAYAAARPGGGHTYGGDTPSPGSGSSGSGSSGDDGSGAIFQILIWLAIEHPTIGIPLLIGVGAFYLFSRRSGSLREGFTTRSPRPAATRIERQPPIERSARQSRMRAELERLRQVDETFSLIVFEDFVHALFVEAHVARGAGTLSTLTPWLSEAARACLASTARVEGIVIGALRYTELRGGDDASQRISVKLEIEANYTEIAGAAASYWVVERWTFSRSKTARSRPPKRARVFDCPNCGAPLDKLVGARCEYCKTVVDTGDYDWHVERIDVVDRRARPPALTGTTPERGTELPTIVDPRADERFQALMLEDPELDWEALGARVRRIFEELNRAWNARDLSTARPYLADFAFDTLGYWVETYRRAELRNLNEGARITQLVLARVGKDAHYAAVTVRVFAIGRDYTLDSADRVVGGDRQRERPYSEYWTLVRGVSVRGAPSAEAVCPNCGAPLAVNQAGECSHCRVEVTRGDFDWVLSRIEQDDAY